MKKPLPSVALWAWSIYFALPLSASALDLGFRYQNGKCVNGEGKIGLNPFYFGPCSDMRDLTLNRFEMAGIDFSGSKFTNADLQLTNFRTSRFVDVDFTGAKLMGANFLDSTFEKVNFMGANLRRAKFSGATFLESRFVGVDFRGFDLSYFQCVQCTFDKADFSEANLTEAVIDQASFSEAILANAKLIGAMVTHSTFANAVLRGSNWNQADVSGSNFAKAKYSMRTQLPFNEVEAKKQKMIQVKATDFMGVATNLPYKDIAGWSPCHRSSYDRISDLSSILKSCKATHVMMGCRKTGEPVLEVAAFGAYDRVFREIGREDGGTYENGVTFYFGKNSSVGFARPGVISRSANGCDVENTSSAYRFCIRLQSDQIVAGYRCGGAVALNNDKYERVFFKANF
ncbi:MAG: pentapeptide repeat-containing protein [Bacteriovoracia bacterium]